MKITITGSLGHIGRPLTEQLIKKGHVVTVISSRPEKQKDIESLGARAAIGSVEDAGFLTTSFAGADAVYTMVPPANYLNPELDPVVYSRRIGTNYARAIQESGIKRVVHLSSVGAHLDKGSGLILGHHDVEVILNRLSGVSITYLRPVGFYYNLYSFVAMIKKEGIIAANYGADEMLIWVSPTDIAEVVAEELETDHADDNIRYVASDELTGNETARILGAAIGKPDLKWIIIPGEQMQHGLVAAGLNPHVAAGMVEMFASQHSGVLTADYFRNKPAAMGKVKLADFAKEFAAAFKQN
jgi:uncharacterized protein YbjT (DUF2867 family)